MDPITFFALAVPLVLVAGLVVLHPNPVYSALFLVLNLGRGLSRVALGGGAILIVELVVLLGRAPTEAPTELPEGFGTVVGLSERLFTDFLIPFEVTSVLLLVAVIGAVVLAQRQT